MPADKPSQYAQPGSCNCPDCMLSLWTRDRELARRTALRLRYPPDQNRGAA